jgi:hypothetical protein
MSSLSGMKKNLAVQAGAPSNHKQRLSIEQRISALEPITQQLVGGHNFNAKKMPELEQRLALVETSVHALIDLAGVELVQDRVVKLRREAIENEAIEYAARVEEAVKVGNLLVVDTIDAECLVAFQDKTPEGKVRVPAIIHTEMETLEPALQESLLGKKVGDTVSVSDGKYTTTVLGIWKEAPVPAKSDATEATATSPAEPQQ